MEFTNQFIFLTGLLLCVSIVAGIVSKRTGAPLLLMFLSVGVLFGEDGLGIVFNDMELSYLVCSFALAVILFDGGLHTPLSHFRTAVRPASLLATLGVLFTTLVIGAGLMFILDFAPLQALLFGAIVASTDAAAVFLLLRQRGVVLPPRISHTLEVESGINDPMAIFLTLAFVQLLLLPEEGSWYVIAGEFVRQVGIGAAVGYTSGKLITVFFNRIELDAGLYPIFALAAGLFVFGATNLLGGSGFLAAYIAGLLVGNVEHRGHAVVRQFMDGLAWLAQLGMLLVLGLLVTPRHLVEDIPLGIIVTLILMLVARPLAVFITLAFEPFSWREKLFISWVGLRGAIPIYLAIIPVMAGLEGHYFNIAFIVVVFSLLLQGWTIHPMARLLNIR